MIVCYITGVTVGSMAETPTGPTTEAITDGYCEIVSFLLIGIFMTPICCLGAVGNILSFIVFSTAHPHPTILLLKMLTISDTCYILTNLLTRGIGEFSEMYNCKVGGYISKYIFPVWGAVAVKMTSWITCLITFFRYYVVCHPFSVYKLPGLKGTRWILFTMIVVGLAMEIPRYFEITYENHFDANLNTTCFDGEHTELYKNQWYQLFYRNIFVLGTSMIIPMFWCTILTIRLVVTIIKNISIRSHLSVKTQMFKHRNEHESHITRVAVIVIVIYIVCQLPAVTYAIMRISMDDYEECQTYHYVTYVGELMLVVNSSINFIVYVSTTPSFREKLMCFSKGGVSHMSMRGQTEGKMSFSENANVQPYKIETEENMTFGKQTTDKDVNQCTHL